MKRVLLGLPESTFKFAQSSSPDCIFIRYTWADLKRADYIAKQRAMEDALMALEFIENVQDMMMSKMYKL
ncbi:hypothetical protein L2E82_03984 [Cichorium intybus]|uniref:Uncharacterized protein n=1 Tax=Cichorium intybus TaxID=13427 RepID=A0ACB9H5B9_CICIN|nr:hypothetical protein L2E82_03984 [Cichorium intybus]